MSPENQNTNSGGKTFGFGVEDHLLEIYIWELVLVGSSLTLLFLLYRWKFVSKAICSIPNPTPESGKRVELDKKVPLESPQTPSMTMQVKEEDSMMDFGGSGDDVNSLNLPETSLSAALPTLTIVKTCDLGVEDAGDNSLATERDDILARISSLEDRFGSNEKTIANTLEEIKVTKDELAIVQQKLDNLKNMIENERNQISTSITKAVHVAIKSMRSSSKSLKPSTGKYTVINGKETAIQSELQSLDDKIRMLKMQADNIITDENFGQPRNFKSCTSLVDLRPLSKASYVSTIKSRSPQLLSSRSMRASSSPNTSN